MEDAIQLEKRFSQESDFKQNQTQDEEVEKASKEIAATYANTSMQYEGEIPSSAIGVIRIDKIEVVLPIMKNAGEYSLTKGAGLLEDTDLPSSKENTITVLAGHRGGRNEAQTFLNIDKLETGDEIKITTREETLYYEVVGQEVIEPTDWSKFTREKGKTKLFLMSCHPYPENYQRLLVKAELVK